MTVTPSPSSRRVVFPSTLARFSSTQLSSLSLSPSLSSSPYSLLASALTSHHDAWASQNFDRRYSSPEQSFDSQGWTSSSRIHVRERLPVPDPRSFDGYQVPHRSTRSHPDHHLSPSSRGAHQYDLPTAFPASSTLFLQLLRLQLSLSSTSPTSSNKSLASEERGRGVLPRAAAHRVASTLVSIHTLFVLRTGSEELWGEMDYLEELAVDLVKELEAVGTAKGGEGVELRFLDEVNNIELDVDDAPEQQGHLRPHPQTLLPNPWSASSTFSPSSRTPPLTPSSSLSSFGDDTPSPSTPTSLLSPTPLLDASPSQTQSSEAANIISFRPITTQVILHLDRHLREVLQRQLAERQSGSSTSILPTRILISTSYLLYLLSPASYAISSETPSAHYHLSSTLTFIADLWNVASQRGGEARAFGATGCLRASEESLGRMEYVLRLRDTALRVRESLSSREVVGGGGGRVVGGERMVSRREKSREVGEVEVDREGSGMRGIC